MRSKNKYSKFKWGSLFFTLMILGIGITVAVLLPSEKEETAAPKVDKIEFDQTNSAGHYTNAAFGKLISENLSEFAFLNEISFEGKENGQLIISGILSSPKRLVTACPDLKPYSTILESLKDAKIEIQGHLGANEQGNGYLICDAILLSGHKIPGAPATEYIEKYTALNDLFDAPIDQIHIDNTGIYFEEEIPKAIQIASYNLTLPSFEE